MTIAALSPGKCLNLKKCKQNANQIFLRFTILDFQNLERFSKFYDSRSYLAANHVVLIVFNCQFFWAKSGKGMEHGTIGKINTKPNMYLDLLKSKNIIG